jgi:hypothetical protein
MLACKALFSGDDFPHGLSETPSLPSFPMSRVQDQARYARPILAL